MLLVRGMDVLEIIDKGITNEIKSLHVLLLDTYTTKVTTILKEALWIEIFVSQFLEISIVSSPTDFSEDSHWVNYMETLKRLTNGEKVKLYSPQHAQDQDQVAS